MQVLDTMKLPPEQVAQRIRLLAMENNSWRGKCINLIPSENIVSPTVRELMASDFAHRYAEGQPYQRFYCGTKYIDEIEHLTNELAKELFRAEHVNVQVISGSAANLAIFYALTKPGNTIMTLAVPDGGHISYMKFGGAGARGLEVEKIPFDPHEMTVDIDKLPGEIRRVKPVLVLFGGSVMLFTQPVRAAVEAASEVNATIGYDAAHVLGLIGGGQFQDPLHEGAAVMSSSTHKTFPGPQGGIILCRSDISKKIDRAVFPGITSNHHLHRLAGLAVTLAEMKKFGADYAQQVIENAKALAGYLSENGFDVLCSHKGFTASHQVLINVSRMDGGDKVSRTLEKANIICNKNLIPVDDPKNALNPSGIRLGTQEITRLGFKKTDMEQIADLIKKAVIDNQDAESIALEVDSLMTGYRTVHYCFESAAEAYKYMKFY